MYIVVFALVMVILLYWIFCSTKQCKPDLCSTYNVGVNPAGMALCGEYLFVANNNNYGIQGSDSVTVINVKTGKLEATIQDSSFNGPYTITADSCCEFVYVTNSNASTVTKISTDTLSVVDILQGFDGPSGLILHGKYAFVNNYGATPGKGSGNGNTISVYDLKTKTIVKTITTDLAPAAITKYDDKLIVVNYVNGNPGTGTLQIIHMDTYIVDEKKATGLSGPFDVVTDGCTAYVSNFGSNNFFPYGNTVSGINLKTLKIDSVITLGIQPSGLALCDNKLYVTNYNTLYSDASFSQLVPGQGTVSIIDVCDKKCPKICPCVKVVGQSPANIIVCHGVAYVSNYTSNTVNAFRV